MINERDRDALGHLGEAMSEQADYIEHPDYGYVPSSMDIDNREWGSVAEAFEHRTQRSPVSMIYMLLKPDNGVSREDYLEKAISEETGFDEFSFVAQGTATTILLGRNEHEVALLRISPHLDRINKALPSYRSDCVRAQFPGLLQPLQEPVEVDGTMQVEVLPAGQVVVLTTEQKAVLNQYLSDITEGTCYEVSLQEALVLPDGSVVGFDPGEITYKDDFWDLTDEAKLEEEQRSIDLVKMRQQAWNVPAQLQWVGPTGELKQDSFFPYRGQMKEGGSIEPEARERFGMDNS